MNREPEVGDWFCHCCLEDIERIMSIPDLEYYKEEFQESGGCFFPTLGHAIEYYGDEITIDSLNWLFKRCGFLDETKKE